MSERAEELTTEEVDRTMQAVGAIVPLIMMIDPGSMRAIDRELGKFDTLGPMLDPTAYMLHSGDNDANRRILHALIVCRESLEKIKADAAENMAAVAKRKEAVRAIMGVLS